jgi:coenzyme F420-dependent glucose-6-phosphate dehydrogenase
MRYLHFCAHEQFGPDELLRQAVEAEQAGFDGIGCSDHLQPWGEGGEVRQRWVWLGRAGDRARSLRHRRHPAGTALSPGADRPGLGFDRDR